MKKGFFKTMALAAVLLTMTSCGRYDVIFNLEGGTLQSGETEQEVAKGEDAQIPEVTRDGYVFDKWLGETENIQQDTMVYAQWTKMHTVTFDPNGGEVIAGEETVSVVDGEAAKAPAVQRDGYEQDGWDREFDQVTGDLTVKANWRKWCSVEFDAGGGTVARGDLNVQVLEGDTVEAPTLRWEGYVFKGWDKNVGKVTDDIRYTAQWERKTFSNEELYEIARYAVVTVYCHEYNDQTFGTATGFFIDDQGTLVTNYHVLEDAAGLSVEFEDGGKYDVVEVLGVDKENDLAILRVDKTGNEYLKLSDNPIGVGDKICVYGSPKGISNTMNFGAVTNTRADKENHFFLHDASISHGSSGSPVLNDCGEVIGVVSAAYSDGNDLNITIYASLIEEIPQDIRLEPLDYYIEEYAEKGMGGACYDPYVFEVKEEESNNSFEDAQLLLVNGTTVNGNIKENSDEFDVYEIYTGNGYVDIQFGDADGETDENILVGVYDGDGELIEDCVSNTGRLQFYCDLGDIYYIAITSAFSDSSNYGYVMYVTTLED